MATLVEGHNYGLSSENSTSVIKSVFHVKLTDSALRALEEFKRIKDATGRHPTIQFQNQNGVIKVPIHKSSDSPDGQRTFEFSLSTIPLDPKGSFECIKQNDASRDQELDLLGAMLQKVSVRGTDDSYKTARDRMTQAEEESKKQRAKEIKPSGPNIGTRIKKVVRRPLPAAPSSHSSSNHSSSSSAPKPSPSSYKITPPSRSSGHRTEEISNSFVHGSGHRSNNVSKPALSSNSNVANRASSVMNMPFRDRIVHLLAIRPYRTPELLIRLQKDGIKDKDKNALSSMLGQVGNFNPREKNYVLAKHVFSEVKPDWPYYTDYERQLLKRKLNKEPPLSASTSPAVSPCHSTSSQGSPNSSQKRVIEEEKSHDQPPKKQRIAHSGQRDISDTSSRNSSSISTKITVKSSPNPVSPESPGTGNQENNNLMEAVTLEDKPDYMRKYLAIHNADDRQKYKADFNCEYEEYRNLHSKIEHITNKFVELKNQLQRQQKDTLDYKNVRKRIMSEYKQVKEDAKYMEQRRRHDYLHHKLGHIKKLISDYDHSRLGVS